MPNGIVPVPEEGAATSHTLDSAHFINVNGVTDLMQYVDPNSLAILPDFNVTLEGRVIELLEIPGRTDCNGNPIERVWPPIPKEDE